MFYWTSPSVRNLIHCLLLSVAVLVFCIYIFLQFATRTCVFIPCACSMWYTYMHTSYGIFSPFKSFPFPGITSSLCWMPVPLGARSSLILSVLFWKVYLTFAVQSHALPQCSFLFTILLPSMDGLWSFHVGLPFLLLEWKAYVYICVCIYIYTPVQQLLY